jgi:hypothetical protein
VNAPLGMVGREPGKKPKAVVSERESKKLPISGAVCQSADGR